LDQTLKRDHESQASIMNPGTVRLSLAQVS